MGNIIKEKVSLARQLKSLNKEKQLELYHKLLKKIENKTLEVEDYKKLAELISQNDFDAIISKNSSVIIELVKYYPQYVEDYIAIVDSFVLIRTCVKQDILEAVERGVINQNILLNIGHIDSSSSVTLYENIKIGKYDIEFTKKLLQNLSFELEYYENTIFIDLINGDISIELFYAHFDSLIADYDLVNLRLFELCCSGKLREDILIRIINTNSIIYSDNRDIRGERLSYAYMNGNISSASILLFTEQGNADKLEQNVLVKGVVENSQSNEILDLLLKYKVELDDNAARILIRAKDTKYHDYFFSFLEFSKCLSLRWEVLLAVIKKEASIDFLERISSSLNDVIDRKWMNFHNFCSYIAGHKGGTGHIPTLYLKQYLASKVLSSKQLSYFDENILIENFDDDIISDYFNYFYELK